MLIALRQVTASRRKVRKRASRGPAPPEARVRSWGDRLNRVGAMFRIRRGFKFSQFEANEFARTDELAQQRAQRRRV
jgi:hypothetical protein